MPATLIQGEWASRELKLRLAAAVDESAEDDEDARESPEGATVHDLASQTDADRATVHGGEGAVDQALVKAGRWLLQASAEQLAQLSGAQQQQLKTGLRMVLEVIASR